MSCSLMDRKREEDEAVRMSYYELGVRWVGGLKEERKEGGEWVGGCVYLGVKVEEDAVGLPGGDGEGGGESESGGWVGGWVDEVLWAMHIGR